MFAFTHEPSQLTKELSVQQTAWAVQEEPPPRPPTVIGLQPSPMRPAMFGSSIPSRLLSSLSVVGFDWSMRYV